MDPSKMKRKENTLGEFDDSKGGNGVAIRGSVG